MKTTILLTILLFVSNTYAQSCLTDWQYAKSITLSNSNASDLTDHQVKITFDSQALIQAGKMNSDGSDLRFALDCCQPLCFYVEGGMNTSTTDVWVNVPFIPSNGTADIRMYYGNTIATDAQNPSCTFDIWDGFEGGQLNAFQSVCGTNTITFAGDTVTNAWSSSGIIQSMDSVPQGYIYTAEANVVGASGTWPGLYWHEDNVDSESYAVLINTTQARISKKAVSTNICSGHNWASTLYTYSSVQGIWSVTWRGTGDIIADFPTVGPITSTDNQHTLNDDLRVGFGGISSGTGSISLDWIRVRKYAAIDPSATIGAEEALTNVAVSLSAGSLEFCEGSSTSLDAGPGLSGYTWNTGETVQVINVDTTGTYVVTGVDANGCLSSDSASITVNQSPAISLGSDTTVCSYVEVTFDAGGGFTNYLWTSGNTAQTETATMPGIYYVEVTDTNGCNGSDTVEVIHLPEVIAAFSQTAIDLDYTFTNSSTNAQDYYWDFGDGNSSTSMNPTHSYTSQGTFDVCLTVTSSDGCVDSTCTTITVIDSGIGSTELAGISAFPNPSKDVVTVQSDWNSLEFELRDANGRLLKEGTFKQGENTLDIADLSNGVYFLQLKDHGQIKLIKE